MIDGKLYFATDEYDFYCFDMRTQELTRKAALPEELYMPFLLEYKGYIYMLFGADRDYKGSDLRNSISDRVYRYDMTSDKWYLAGEGALKFMGKFDSGFGYVEMQPIGCAMDKGIALVDMSIEGGRQCVDLRSGYQHRHSALLHPQQRRVRSAAMGDPFMRSDG